MLEGIHRKAHEVFTDFTYAPLTSWSDLTRGKPILVIAPHADDETLGCGGLIAQTAAQGVGVTVALLTDGARSHIGSLAYPTDRLRAAREQELKDALMELGAAEADILTFARPDGFLSSSDAHAEIILDRLEQQITSKDIGSIFVTWEADPHPDHQAASQLAGALLARLPKLQGFSYPIWGLTLGDNVAISANSVGALVLPIELERASKLSAIAKHRSQTTTMIGDAEEAFMLTEEHLSLFCTDREIFIPLEAARVAAIDSGRSVPIAHFEILYRDKPDPWGYESGGYEMAKYRHTIELLTDRRYQSGVELGCSIGVLTKLLSEKCDTLLGVDGAASAVEAARQRLRDDTHVTIEQMIIPGQLPEGMFDLIVFSEVLYFFCDEDLALLARFIDERLRPGGVCILVNFLGDTESPQTGDQAAGKIMGMCKIPHAVTHVRREHYRVDILQAKTPATGQ